MNTNNERSTTVTTASAKIEDENSSDVVFELEASLRSNIPANITIVSKHVNGKSVRIPSN